jgi:flagellar M-ring protein FliF
MSTEAAALPRPSIIPPSLKPLALLIGIAAAVAAGVVIVLWSKEPTYSLLYGNLGQQDAAQIAQALDTNNIPYKLDAGTITVRRIAFTMPASSWRRRACPKVTAGSR